MRATTRAQRVAMARVYGRVCADAEPGQPVPTYRAFRRTATPAIGLPCLMVRYAGMWLGIEPDGYTHS